MVQRCSAAIKDNLFFIGALACLHGWASAVSAQDQILVLPSVANLSAEVTETVISLSWVDLGLSNSSSSGASRGSGSSLFYLVSASADGSGWQVLGRCSAPCNQYTVQLQDIQGTAARQCNFSVVAYTTSAQSDPIFIAVNVTRAGAAQSPGLIVGVTVAVSALCGLVILASVRISRLLSRRPTRHHRTGRSIATRAARPGFQERMSSHLPKELFPDGLYRGLKPSANESRVFLTAASAFVHTSEADSGADLGYYSNYWRQTVGRRVDDSSSGDIGSKRVTSDDAAAAAATKAGGRWASHNRSYATADSVAADAAGGPPADPRHAGDSVTGAGHSSSSDSMRWQAGYDDCSAGTGGNAASGSEQGSAEVSGSRGGRDHSSCRGSSDGYLCGSRTGCCCCPFATGSLVTVGAAPSGVDRQRLESRRPPRPTAKLGGRELHASRALPILPGSGPCGSDADFVNVSDVSLLGKVNLQDSFIPLHLFPPKPGTEAATSPLPNWNRRSGGAAEGRRLIVGEAANVGIGGNAIPFEISRLPLVREHDELARASSANRHQVAADRRQRPSFDRSRPESDHRHPYRSPISSEMSSSLERPASSQPPEGRRLGAAASVASGGRWLPGGGGGSSSSRPRERELSATAHRPPLAYSSPASSQLLDGGVGFYGSSHQASSSSSSSLQPSLSHAERYTRDQLRRTVEAVRTKAPAAATAAPDEGFAFSTGQTGGVRSPDPVPTAAAVRARRPYDAAETWLSAAALLDSQQAILAGDRSMANAGTSVADRSSRAGWPSGGDGPRCDHPRHAEDVGRRTELPSGFWSAAAVGQRDRAPTMTFYARPRKPNRVAPGAAMATTGPLGVAAVCLCESPAPDSIGPQRGTGVDGRTFGRDHTDADGGPLPSSAADDEADRVKTLLRELHLYRSSSSYQQPGGGTAADWAYWHLETDM